MANLNQVTLVGRMVRDPELRYTTQGTPTCRLRVAINRKYKKDDAWVDVTTFVDVDSWRGQAEACAAHLKKGSELLVVGWLKQHEWTNKEGQKRSVLRITAERIQFLHSKNGSLPDAKEPAESENTPF